MSILELTGLTHSIGDQLLYRDSGLSLFRGEHMGVVGQNGAGKSTLLKICTGRIVPDAGRVVWHPGIRVGYLDQYAELPRELTMEDYLRTAFRELYEREERMNALYLRAAEGDLPALEQAADCQTALEQAGFYQLDTRLKQVTEGLGLSAPGLGRKLAEMSGGQRARVILARLLLEQPDALLLDEPTNFLDREHVDWLADFLRGFPGAFLIVSHDQEFLERITDCVCDLGNACLTKYRGGFEQYRQKKAARQEDYRRRYQAQQQEIRRTEEFIRRNIAGQNTRIAQGRRKQLARMERLEAPSGEQFRPRFVFSCLPFSPGEQLWAEGLAVGRTAPVLKGLNFSVKGGEKVVITGFNGVGKSTLLRTLLGELRPLGGSFGFSEQAAPGYFAQDIAWERGERTPTQLLFDAHPLMELRQVRGHLARCGVTAGHALQPVATLSGGEQARVRLCLLGLQPCNFLVLDEPTNHLDAASKEALAHALREFPGTVLLVSHEEAFYRDWADRVLQVGGE